MICHNNRLVPSWRVVCRRQQLQRGPRNKTRCDRSRILRKHMLSCNNLLRPIHKPTIGTSDDNKYSEAILAQLRKKSRACKRPNLHIETARGVTISISNPRIRASRCTGRIELLRLLGIWILARETTHAAEVLLGVAVTARAIARI